MNPPRQEYLFFILLVAGVSIITLLSGSLAGYLSFPLLLLLLVIMVITRSWPDRGFYLACAGEPLVIACSVMNIWAGLFAVCLLAGIVSGTFGLLKSRQDVRLFALFCGSSFIIALLIQASNHVILPLLAVGSLTIIVIAIQSVRMYQFRKQFSGA